MMQRLAVEADAMSRVVQNKAHQPWIGIALDAETRHVRAFHGGDRSHKRATRLWTKIPDAYRQHTTFDTDQSVV